MLDFHKYTWTGIVWVERRSRRRNLSSKLILISVVPVLSFCVNPLQADNGSGENISILMSSSVVDSPVGSVSSRRFAPGAVVDYSVAVTGPSFGGSPATFFVFANPIPPEMALFVGDIAGANSGPVAFVETDSSLKYAFEGLSSQTDALQFSNNGGKSFDYVPVRDAEGYDQSVTNIRIMPNGALMPANGRHTRFSVRYRTKVK